MTISRRVLLVVATLPLLLAISACGGAGTPTPTPSASGTATATPSPTGSPTSDEDADETPAADPVEAATIVVNGAGVRVVGNDGSAMAEGGYDGDAAALAALMANALGVDPVVSSTAALGTGCDADQTMYDFGGIVLRTPGYVGSVGSIEIDVDGPVTTGGVPIETLGGVRVGAPQAAALTALGPTVDVYTLGPLIVGYDRLNPDEPEFDGIGMLAEFDGGELRRFVGIHYFYGDC